MPRLHTVMHFIAKNWKLLFQEDVFAAWFGHAQRLRSGHLVSQALRWIPPKFQKKRGRPIMNWNKILDKDLNVIDLTTAKSNTLLEQ